MRYILLLMIIVCESVSAQWNSNTTINNEICIDVNHQQEPRLITDSKGGAIICWTDYRTDTTNKIGDVYVQRIKADGTNAWSSNGVPICVDIADQTSPFIVEDGLGGAIISWQDIRNGNRDIYAQRIDSSGNVLWATNGVAVVQKNSEQRNPHIVTDGSRGAIVVWEDSINGNSDIFAQRINANGTIAWNTNGIAICISPGIQINSKISSDGNGGAIITWQDRRNGNDYDIYAQKVSNAGSLSWITNGIPVCVKVNTQNNPKIETDNAGGAYVIWQDKRNAVDFDIYAQHVNANGSVTWTANGTVVCNASGSQSAVDATSSGVTNGLLVTWKDNRTSYTHIYGQYLNSGGTAVGITNGFLLSTNPLTQINPNIIGVGNNEAIVVWQDSSAGNWDVYAQKISTYGTVMWNIAGVCISNATDNQISPKNVSNDNGGCIFSFQDKRNGDYDIYATQIKSNGTFTFVNSATKSTSFFSIFPNPNQGKFSVNVDEKIVEKCSLKITNLIGEIVYFNNVLLQNDMNLNLPNGVYFVSLTNEIKNTSYNSKMIVCE